MIDEWIWSRSDILMQVVLCCFVFLEAGRGLMGCSFMTGLGDWEGEDLALVGMKECKDNKVVILAMVVSCY